MLVGPSKEAVENATKRVQAVLESHINLGPVEVKSTLYEERMVIGMSPDLGYPLRAKILGPQVRAWRGVGSIL